MKLNTTSDVAADAVAAHNENLIAATRTQAVDLITAISAEQSKIGGCNDRIKVHREALDKLSKDVVSEASVLGGSLPANSNQETIAKVIEKANKDRQFVIEQQSSRLVSNINAEQDAVKAIEKRIAELRVQLLKLAPPVVTVDQIVG